MKIKVKCPVRIDLTGGFTDVYPFYVKMEAHHINAAINSYVKIIIEPRNDGKFLVTSPDNKFEYPSFKKLEMDEKQKLISTAYKFFSFTKGANLSILLDVPSGAGLGTSGALSTALVAGLYAIKVGKSPKDNLGNLAMTASKIENTAGNLSGSQDHLASVFGKINQFSFYRDEWSRVPIQLPSGAIKVLESLLLIGYPGGRRTSGDIVTEVMTKYKSGDRNVSEALNGLNDLSTKIHSALKETDLARLAKLFRKVIYFQQKLSPSIIGVEHKELIEDLKIFPDIGYKMLGGGGPGACVLILSSNKEGYDRVSKILEELRYKKIPVKIASDGIKINFSNSSASNFYKITQQ